MKDKHQTPVDHQIEPDGRALQWTRSPRSAGVPRSSGSVTVLIAEDSPTQALKLRGLLERHEFRVISAQDGQEAIIQVREQHPTLVISDINMPEMDGYELCMAIRGDEAMCDLPVILLTSLSEPRDVLKGIECGADSFVVKPYADDVLVSRIEHLLANPSLRKRGIAPAVREILYEGQHYKLDAGSINSVELLLSTYEASIQRNRELAEAREKLERQSEELLGALQDVTEAHEQLKKAQMELLQAEKLQSVGKLAAAIAHEVKNPLAVLKIGIEWLGESADGDPEQKNLVLAEMKDAVERAGLVIGDLLDLSAPKVLQLKSESINAVIEKTLRLVKHEIATSRVKIVRAMADDLPPCNVDANKILQVLINLLVNACHAMSAGGVLTITTSKNVMESDDADFKANGLSAQRYRAGDTAVIVEIRDTGTGIPEHALGKIFEPFFTTKPSGEGTGLGLPVARQIMNLHGGTISVRNSALGGAVVTLGFICPSPEC